MFKKVKEYIFSPVLIKYYRGLLDYKNQVIDLKIDRINTLESERSVFESESRLWSSAYDAEARIVKQMRQLVSDAIVTLSTLPSMSRTTKTDRSELVRVIKKISEVYDESSDTPNS